MALQPCMYIEGLQVKTDNAGKRSQVARYCGKVCDEGRTMCPRHLLVFAAEEEKRAERASKRRKKAIDWAKKKSRLGSR